MKTKFLALGMALLLIFGVACSSNKKSSAKLDDDTVKNQLQQAGLNDVKVDVDNDKKVVKLEGNVKTDAEKAQAEQIARQAAPDFVVANEVGIRPEGAESQARKVEGNLDDAIKNDWKALEAQNNWGDQHIRTDVKNGVLTLKGDVDTPQMRADVEKAAAKLPNVQQVVNELDVKSAKGKKANKSGTTTAAE